MPYAANGQISQSPIEGGIEITAEQYQEALAGILRGEVVSIDGGFSVAPKPEPEPQPEPEPLTPEEELAQWRESARVSRRQAKQQLLIADLLSSVQPAIDAIEDDTERAMVQIYWDDATEFERSNAQLIGLGYALGLDDEQIDQLFVDAAKL